MADVLVKKLAKDKIRDEASKRNGYLISAPEKNERGKKLSNSEKVRWEIERYTDPRWAIPERDLKILIEVKKRAKQLDAGHRIGPLKFGQAAVVGLIPVIGDFADVILAYLRVYRKATKVSKGDDILAFKSKMKVRIVALGSIGCIPMLGDLADTILKFNTQNAASLERLLLKRSGYFEVLAKEKASRSTRRLRNHSQPSEDSLPPPRYESAHSYSRKPLAQIKNTPINGTKYEAKNMIGWLPNLAGSKTNIKTHSEQEAVPVRPPRPELTQYKNARQDSNYF